MGSQRVTLADRDATISDMAAQINRLVSDLEESKRSRRSDLSAARTQRIRLERKIDSLTEQAEGGATSRRLSTKLAEHRQQIQSLEQRLQESENLHATVLRDTRHELREERDAALRELAEARQAAQRANDRAESIRAWHGRQTRHRVRPGSPMDAQIQFRYRSRLVDDLREFMDSRFDGGHEGQVATDAVVAYLRASPETTRVVVSELGLHKQIQQQFLDILREHYSVENCAALFMHGNLSHAGYQAISNILAGVYDNINEKFVRLMAPDGQTPIPRLTSLHVLLEYFKQVAEEFGMESVHQGQGGVLNLESVLKSQVEHLLDGVEQGEVPEQIAVQLAADSAGWSKKPTHKIMKNFTSVIVKPILSKNTGRVGDGCNSVHNNRVAALYAGSDSHHLMEKFLNTASTSSGQPIPSLRQQMEALAAGSLHTNVGIIVVLWRLGGDLKFLVDCFGLSGNAATYPCYQCTCHKDSLWMLPSEFPFGQVPETRNHMWMLQMAHAFGEEVGITQPYDCPGCGKQVSGDERHQPVSQEEVRQYGLEHFSHKWGVLPLTSVEPRDAVQDPLHGFLRSVVNMFFVCISMNLHSLEAAQQVSDFIEAELQTETTPVFGQRSRETTRKQVQTWNGKECWRVMSGIGRVVDLAFQGRSAEAGATPAQRQLEEAYQQVSLVFSSFVELMAAWMLDVAEEHWERVAQLLREKAKRWRDAFVLASGSTVDCTPTMHSIIYHYPEMYARHDPLMKYSMQGVEAKHQPIKRAKTSHRNNKSFKNVGTTNNTRGVTTVHTYSTDIMQVTKRMVVRDQVCNHIKSGKGTRKRSRSELNDDPLSATIKQLQQSYLLDLEQAL